MATATKTPTKKKTASAVAIHAQDNTGTHHVVGIGNLRVIIVPEGNFWFAQGLEIDYAAQGTSKADVKKEFEDGLMATVEQHLRMYGTIEKVLKVAPPEVWNDFLYDPNAIRNFYSQVSHHQIEALPFTGIEYIERRAA